MMTVQGVFHKKQAFFFFFEVWSNVLSRYLTWLQVKISVQLFLGGLFH